MRGTLGPVVPWKPATISAVRAFERVTADLDDAEPRRMFGYDCRFANGHLFIGTHQDGIILRLPEPHRSDFRERYGAGLFEPMEGRPMREYVVVPEALHLDVPSLRPWVLHAIDFVRALPPKAKTARKPSSRVAPAKNGRRPKPSPRRAAPRT